MDLLVTIISSADDMVARSGCAWAFARRATWSRGGFGQRLRARTHTPGRCAGMQAGAQAGKQITAVVTVCRRPLGGSRVGPPCAALLTNPLFGGLHFASLVTRLPVSGNTPPKKLELFYLEIVACLRASQRRHKCPNSTSVDRQHKNISPYQSGNSQTK